MPFVDSAIAEADKDKDALGFFPKKVFKEFAQRELLFVATIGSAENEKYAGHLLFDCRFPKAHVLQIVVTQCHRGIGVARSLVAALKQSLTSLGFISIHARVAQDLRESNEFWAKQGFYVQSVVGGGKSRGRTILKRSHELASPQLFGAGGTSLTHPLGISPRTSEHSPVYLMDLNVLFDLGPRRRRNQSVVALFRAERAGHLALAMSSEFSREMHRTAAAGRTDPMLAYAQIFPVYQLSETFVLAAVLAELVELVFPNSAGWAGLDERQQSDLRHIATAIEHRLVGVITSDSALLDAAYQIAGRFRVEIVSPLALGALHADVASEQRYISIDGESLRLLAISGGLGQQVSALLTKLGVSSNDWLEMPSRTTLNEQFGVWVGNQLVAYMHRSKWRRDGMFFGKIACDEKSPHASRAIEVLVQELTGATGLPDVACFALTTSGNQALVREVAWANGFRDLAENSDLAKISVRGVVTPNSWKSYRRKLIDVANLRLPEDPPLASNFDSHIEVVVASGARTYLSVESLEALLSPAIFLLHERRAVISPIRRPFREALLGDNRQLSLLPHEKALSRRVRHYLSAKRNLAKFSRGTLIFFYESAKQRGLSGVLGVAVTRRAYTKSQVSLDSNDFDNSALNADTLKLIGDSKVKAVTAFDNLLLFPEIVPLSFLQQIGCGKSSDLISTNLISNSQAQEIIERGFSNA